MTKNMDNQATIGQKIKQFRKRAGISQLELEMRIGTSPGSISRIESGEVNPTKETLVKIIEKLDLRNTDAASLFNLDLIELPKLVKLAKKLSNTLDLEAILQNSANSIALELNLLGVVICLIEGDKLKAKTFTQSWYTRLVLNILPIPFHKLEVNLSDPAFKKNKFYDVIQTRSPVIRERLSDFCVPPLPLNIANLAQKVSSHKCAISFPLISDENCIGVILFTKNHVDDFKNEYPILEAFSEHIASSIVNAQNYEKLKLELSRLKNG